MTISNMPPPFEAITMHVEDLMGEAQNFLDGEPITTQGQADAIGVLLDNARKAKKAADDQRALEKKPHDDAAKAVQAQWKPTIERCDLVASVAKRALTPWLARLEAEQRAKAEAARIVAEEARQKALDAERAAQASNDLAGAESAQVARKQAEHAERLASKADKAKPQATGGSRAIGLRTAWVADVTDYREFARWCWVNRNADMAEFLDGMAQSFTGTRPAVPGISYREERNAA